MFVNNNIKRFNPNRRIVVNVLNQNSAFAVSSKLVQLMSKEKAEGTKINQFKIFLNTDHAKTKFKDDKIVVYYEKSDEIVDKKTGLDLNGNEIMKHLASITIEASSPLFFPFYHIELNKISGMAWGDEPFTDKNESFSKIRCNAIANMFIKGKEFPASEALFKEKLEAYFVEKK